MNNTQIIIQKATNIVIIISFFLGISFNIKYHKIYIKTKYNKLSKLVRTTHKVEYIVNANNIDTITIEFVNINNFIYFFVSNFTSLNSFFININVNEKNNINIVSVK